MNRDIREETSWRFLQCDLAELDTSTRRGKAKEGCIGFPKAWKHEKGDIFFHFCNNCRVAQKDENIFFQKCSLFLWFLLLIWKDLSKDSIPRWWGYELKWTFHFFSKYIQLINSFLTFFLFVVLLYYIFHLRRHTWP